MECFYRDGKKEGLYKTWYENGNKCIERIFKDGDKEEECKMWYENGNKLKECIYNKDV